MISTPYSWINETARAPALVVLAALTVLVSLALSSIGASLKNETTPLGIISFEIAGSELRARQILDSWPESARRDAFLSTGLDYLYLCLYPLALSLACHLLAVRGKKLRKAGAALSWMVIMAAPLDGVENYALIRMLNSSGGEVWPMVAKWCALPKFGLVILGGAYILIATALLIASRLIRKPKASAAV
jgi:hypothetical protein